MRKAAKKRLTVLVFDENISGDSILDPLREAGIPVVAQEKIMPRGILDIKLLQNLAKLPGHYLITHDADFHRHTGTVEVLKSSNIGAIVLTGLKNKQGPEIAQTILRAWRKIERFIETHQPPFVAKVVTGKIERII